MSRAEFIQRLQEADAIMTGPSSKRETIGISPKVVAAALTYAVVFAITKLGLQWNPVFEQAINGVAAIVAAYLAPPGPVASTNVHGNVRS